MAARRLLSLSLFQTMHAGAAPRITITAGRSDRALPASLLSNTSQNQQHLHLIALLFSGQAAFSLMDESKIAYAQDEPNELPNGNGKGQEENQEARVSGLQRVEDGTVISNVHTIKWRLFTDSGRDLFSEASNFPPLCLQTRMSHMLV